MLKEKVRDKRISPEMFGANPRVFDDHVITVGSVPVTHDPANKASVETYFLFGERVKTFGSHMQFGKVLAQSMRDGYVGYIDMHALQGYERTPTHRVIHPRTIVYRGPDFRSGMVERLGFNALISSGGEVGEFTRVPGLGFVYTDRLQTVRRLETDLVNVAGMLLGTPYLWASRDTNDGLDCSAYVQHVFYACGLYIPRDTDQIAQAFPQFLLPKSERPRKGDIINFHGHVGIMSDSATILHASEFQREVCEELLDTVVARRLASAEGGVTSIIRLPLMG